MRQLTYADIAPYITEGLVTERAHPENPAIRIFNYTPECQFSRKWDDITIQCRGLIMDITTNEILARPFAKFFNYDEHLALGGTIPDEIPVITDKLDGSLGIMYTLDGKPWIATRGSFESEQAVWATDWWRTNKGEEPYGNDITYLFEIIYPQNRIVVNYNFSGLVHLASIETSTGRTVDAMLPVQKVKTLNPHLEIEYIKTLDPNNEEGVVIHYPVADLRLKVKYATYVKLHKVMTGLSEKGIWELLQEKGIDLSPEEVVQDVPDEFFGWLTSVMDDLKSKYKAIELEAKAAAGFASSYATRKEQAEFITKHTAYPGVAFKALDGDNYSQVIFKMIRPHGLSTFKTDEL